MATKKNLRFLQEQLLAGAEGRDSRPRSPFTVRTTMGSVCGALNWACTEMEWLDSVPKIKKLPVAKLRHAKGRCLTLQEFQRLIATVPSVVGEAAGTSWIHIIRGAWVSALRIDELMHVHWSDENQIVPRWPEKGFPVLHIPSERQKNAVEEEIPLLPDFESLLLETAPADRRGWVFCPQALPRRPNGRSSRNHNHPRTSSRWIAMVISRIGRESGIVVSQANDRTGKPEKYVSSHDLRRSCGERLLDADVAPDVIQRVLRHANFETTRKFYATSNVQKDARRLRKSLDVKQP